MAGIGATAAQTTRLIQCELMGLRATIEKHSEFIMKRMNTPLRNVPGDGRSQVEHVHDPVSDVEPITLELNPKANAVFLAQARQMYEQQLLDPSTAQPIQFYSYLPNTTVLDRIAGMSAVIQEVHMPPGDTNAHNLATAKIVVQCTTWGN